MTTTTTPLLGIDWGTSNRRAYLLDENGKLVRQHDDDSGILKVAGDFKASLAALLETLALDRADVVMSGMVGSRSGWREAPYLEVSSPLSRLPESMIEIDSGLPGVRCRIAPGYSYVDTHGLPDVMRGEETQIFGAMQLGAPDGWFLLPGTHSKWVRVNGGIIGEIVTFMTGELYGLMSRQGTLSKVISDSQASVPEAFEAGLQAARRGAFTHMAFCCRALVVTDRMPPEHTASFLSGLLIGTELHDIVQRTSGGNAASAGAPVQIIGSSSLATRYRNALESSGIAARVWQPDDVYLSALAALFNLKATTP